MKPSELDRIQRGRYGVLTPEHHAAHAEDATRPILDRLRALDAITGLRLRDWTGDTEDFAAFTERRKRIELAIANALKDEGPVEDKAAGLTYSHNPATGGIRRRAFT